MSEHLRLSWQDSQWIPHLNPENILDYFCQKSNPFYDKQCNNEFARMQRMTPEQMLDLNGFEYKLLHVQEPILYVIRKQERSGPDNVTPLTDYYILAGIVYQAPDLNSIIQSRVLNSALNLRSALEEFQSLSTFSPANGYIWKSQQNNKSTKSIERTSKQDDFSRFQRKIDGLMKNFCENN